MNIATKSVNVVQETAALLEKLGVSKDLYTGGDMASFSPVTGEQIASLKTVSAAEAAARIEKADAAFRAWRLVPAPKRGELIRLLGEELRAHKADLGRLVSIEAGKITSEGLGEVQEMIDICDFAVGLSRQLYGLTIATERPGHRMMETWHPLGVVGVISAFNFPVAVWSWNTALALVCGNAVVWKPSEKTPLTALASQAILDKALARFGDAPDGLTAVLIGDRDHRRSHGRSPEGAAGFGHRFHSHGPRCRTASRQALRPCDPRTRRQQWRHRLPVCRSRHGAARHCLRRHGHGRPALHDAAPPLRP